MPATRCTIDTSCVIALQILDLIPKLSVLFRRVLIPSGVRIELFRRRGTKKRLQKMFREFEFIERCDRYEKSSVDQLLILKTGNVWKDRGEAEAVVQAADVGGAVIVDDPLGRRFAESFRLEYHGTLWVLERLFELEYISGAEVQQGIAKLKKKGIRLPDGGVAELLRRIGEH